jgi:hypothetical protein
MEDDYENCPATPNSPNAGRNYLGLWRRGAAWAGASAILVASGVTVAALSAGAQLVNSPEAVATTVRATPAPSSLRPQYQAQAPQVPGQIECAPTILRAACPPLRAPAGSGGASDVTSALAWFNKAKAPFNAIQDALKTASSAMQTQDVDGVRSACQQLGSSSQQLGSTLPSPDSALTSEVQGAVDELTTAANMCLAPNATSNTDAIMGHVQNANSHFSNAQQIIKSKSS